MMPRSVGAAAEGVPEAIIAAICLPDEKSVDEIAPAHDG